MKRIEISVLLALVFCFCLNVLCVERECQSIRSDVLRLHVLANSDSAADQQLKYRVRDAVLSECAGLFGSELSAEEAANIARQNISAITAAAEREIAAAGADCSVRVEVGESYFDTRTYGDATLPAGRYEAVRVILGEGEGTNWWCVMFPPMCVSACTDRTQLEQVLDENEMSLVENGYDVRLWCVEWLCRLREGGNIG